MLMIFFLFMFMVGRVDFLSVVFKLLNFVDIYCVWKKYVLVFDEVLVIFKDEIMIYFIVLV